MSMSEAVSAPAGRIVHGRRNIYGYAIGILMIEGYFPRPPGAVGNATTFAFPVLHRVVKGATGDATVHALAAHPPGSPAFRNAIAPWLDAARALEAEGVRAITSSCGFTALFQKELADAVDVPVFATSLLLVPMIARTLGRGRKVGIVTADGGSLTTRHLTGAGIDPGRVAWIGLENSGVFCEMAYEDRHDLSLEAMGAAVGDAVRTLLAREPAIGALLLECSLLPPYAARVQAEFGLPVFDFTTMINMVHAALVRVPFAGYL